MLFLNGANVYLYVLVLRVYSSILCKFIVRPICFINSFSLLQTYGIPSFGSPASLRLQVTHPPITHCECDLSSPIFIVQKVVIHRIIVFFKVEVCSVNVDDVKNWWWWLRLGDPVTSIDGY
jgi:hypothetical protein